VVVPKTEQEIEEQIQSNKSIRDALNDINYAMAELRDIRMSISQKTDEVIS